MKIKELLEANRLSKRFNINEKTPKKSSGKNGATRDPNSTKVGIVVPRIGAGAEGQFEDSPIDLETIEKAYFSEAYIRRAIDKISGLMFKSGWDLVSKNSDALEYVKTRLKLIEESTSITTEELLRELGLNYILYSNSPVIKTRGSENLAGLQASGYYGGEPISGLFAAPPTGFKVARDEFGNPTNYEVSGGAGQGIEFSLEDVSHMTYHKPTGRAYGVPYIQNVLDDVLILRQIEENVARLIYRNLFPLQTYTVGKTVAGYEATDEEIDKVIEDLENMPLDGMVVLPERHSIDTVSTNSATMDANSYLKYFRQRVFTGLGLSESVMGIGDTTNKSTSDNQSSDLNDLVKDFQQSFSSEIQKEIINEILFEGGYDPTLNEEDEVSFIFTEIEQSAKIARENHNTQLWMNNMISHDEARLAIGKDPVENLDNFYISLINGSQSQNDKSGESENKDQPENQSGKNQAPKEQKISFHPLTESTKVVNLDIDTNISKIESQILKDWHLIRDDIVERFEKKQPLKEVLFFTTKLIETSFSKKIQNISLSIIKDKSTSEYVKVEKYLNKESENIGKNILNDINFRIENTKDINNIPNVFDIYNSRIKSIAKTEAYKGMNMNYCLEKIKEKEYDINVISLNEDCAKCSNYSLNLNENKWYEKVPPHHTNCECYVK